MSEKLQSDEPASYVADTKLAEAMAYAGKNDMDEALRTEEHERNNPSPFKSMNRPEASRYYASQTMLRVEKEYQEDSTEIPNVPMSQENQEKEVSAIESDSNDIAIDVTELRPDEPDTFVQDIQKAEYIAYGEKDKRDLAVAHKNIAKAAYDTYILHSDVQLDQDKFAKKLGLNPNKSYLPKVTDYEDPVLRTAFSQSMPDNFASAKKVGDKAKQNAEHYIADAKKISDEVADRYDEADPKSLESIK